MRESLSTSVRDGDGEGAVVDADLHADGDGLLLGEPREARDEVAHRQAGEVEGQRGEAHLLGRTRRGWPAP
jgi:hypothetical protein